MERETTGKAVVAATTAKTGVGAGAWGAQPMHTIPTATDGEAPGAIAIGITNLRVAAAARGKAAAKNILEKKGEKKREG